MLKKLAYFLIRIYLQTKNSHVWIEHGGRVKLSSKFEGYNKIHKGAYFSGSLGFGSYIGNNSIVSGRIGKYCSIADNVVFLTKTHPVTTFVSTHPAFYSLKKQCGMTFVNEQKFDEEPCYKDESVSIIVGNDVYIGYGAIVIGPCEIGDGAVVAAGSLVTGDVEPFTIVGGGACKRNKKKIYRRTNIIYQEAGMVG